MTDRSFTGLTSEEFLTMVKDSQVYKDQGALASIKVILTDAKFFVHQDMGDSANKFINRAMFLCDQISQGNLKP
jgi:hypothetical protein